MQPRQVLCHIIDQYVRDAIPGTIFIDSGHTGEVVRASNVKCFANEEGNYVLVETNRGGRLFCAGDKIETVEFPNVPFFSDDDSDDYEDT
jgi:hypothetical protein